MPKWSKDYEIKKHRSRALIHLARLIDNPDSFADNFRLKFNNLASFEKTVFVTS